MLITSSWSSAIAFVTQSPNVCIQQIVSFQPYAQGDIIVQYALVSMELAVGRTSHTVSTFFDGTLTAGPCMHFCFPGTRNAINQLMRLTVYH